MGDRVPHAAARAAAYTVTALACGMKLDEVSIAEIDDEPMWLPWAAVSGCSCCHPKNTLDEDWAAVAILAAEIVAMKPEASGSGPRWEAIKLEALDIAARLMHNAPLQTDPLWWVHLHLCDEWWTSAEGPERDKCMEHMSAEFENLWNRAMEIVRFHTAQIRELTRIIQRVEYLDGPSVREWWDETIQPLPSA